MPPLTEETTEPRRKWDVFVSHNQEAKPWVRQAVSSWRVQGLSVFFDEDDVPPGADLVGALEEAIECSRKFVIFLTPASVRSDWVALELALAACAPAEADRIVPVHLEPTASEDVRLMVRRLSWVDLTNSSSYEREYQRLLGVIGIDVGGVSSPSQPVPSGDVDLDPTRVILKLDRDFASFNEDDKEKLMRAIRELLEVGNLEILGTRPGSVEVEFELPRDVALRLHGAIRAGELDAFRIIEVRLESAARGQHARRWSSARRHESRPRVDARIPAVGPKGDTPDLVGPRGYDVFISYSHAADRRLARSLHRGLEQLAKPWYRMRALRVFRDETNLAADPDGWAGIDDALESSRFMVLMASRAAARSNWVSREVERWIELGRSQRLLIALTDGEIAWDDGSDSIDWQLTDALPRSMEGLLEHEPLWVDLRGLEDQRFRRDNSALREGVARITAAVRGLPLDELTSADWREYHRTMRTAIAAVVVLSLLLVALGVATMIARQARFDAVSREVTANAQRMAMSSELIRTQEPRLLERSIEVAIESLSLEDSFEGRTALRRALELYPKKRLGVLRHPDAVSSVAVDATETLLATGCYDERVRLFRLPSLEAWSQFDFGTRIESVALSSDGRLVAACGRSRDVVVWDAQSGAEVARLTHPDGGSIARFRIDEIVFHPADGSLITATSDGDAFVWDVPSQKVIASTDCGYSCWSLGIDASGERVAVAVHGGSEGASIALWDWRSGAAPRVMPLSEDPFAVALNRDGTRLAVGTGVGAAWVFDTASGGMLWERRAGNGELISDVAFDPSSDRIAVASWEQAASIWSAQEGREMLRIPHDDKVDEILFLDGGASVITASYDGTATIWQAEGGSEVAKIALELPVDAVAIQPASRVVAYAQGKVVSLLSLDDGAVTASLSLPHAVSEIAFSEDGSSMACGLTSGDVALLAFGLNDLQVPWLLGGERGRVQCLAFEPGGLRLAAGHRGGALDVWAVPGGETLGKATLEDSVWDLAWSSDGSLAVAGRSAGASIWRRENPGEVVPIELTEGALSVAISDDGKFIGIGGGPTPMLLNIATGGRREIASRSRHVSFSPDDQWLLGDNWITRLGEADGVIELEVSSTGTAHGLSSNGFSLATGTSERIAHVWDFPSGLERDRLPHPDSIVHVSWIGDERLVTYDRLGTLRIWSTLLDDLKSEALARLGQRSDVLQVK